MPTVYSYYWILYCYIRLYSISLNIIIFFIYFTFFWIVSHIRFFKERINSGNGVCNFSNFFLRQIVLFLFMFEFSSVHLGAFNVYDIFVIIIPRIANSYVVLCYAFTILREVKSKADLGILISFLMPSLTRIINLKLGEVTLYNLLYIFINVKYIPHFTHIYIQVQSVELYRSEGKMQQTDIKILYILNCATKVMSVTNWNIKSIFL